MTERFDYVVAGLGALGSATAWQLARRGHRVLGLERFELGDVAHRVVGGFSHGMSRRLSVVLAALHEPSVLLLDEPFDGVDPLGVEATLEVVADARARGACVLLSTHLRDLALDVAREAHVMVGGHFLLSGPPSQFPDRSEVLRSYMGEGSLVGAPAEVKET